MNIIINKKKIFYVINHLKERAAKEAVLKLKSRVGAPNPLFGG